MKRGPDAAALLTRALVASAHRNGCSISIDASESRTWASATFLGARHQFTLSAEASAQLDCWLTSLPEEIFQLRGHLVADLVVTRKSVRGSAVIAEVEILTIESD